MTMSMGQEKKRISERLERLGAEREKLSAELNELEIAERVLHASRIKRLKPRSWRQRDRRTLERRSQRSTERKANDRCRPYR